ncbi:MAG: hypothetical protein A3J49_01230 [Gallionellales bacterium RIFCSPHIGHO2_02_FULL_57_16]|nr:MAG: hypothetical protein A3J49_01230 [Gallionellales bacterium RIFCSPHIGHO2_02_FULL_57_16]
MHQLLIDLVEIAVPWIEMLGIAVVLWGAIEGLIGLLMRIKTAMLRKAQPVPISHIRVAIGEKTALGLDFFLAGDIIQTIMVPTWESLAILGGIVVIRTIIAFFLNKDLRELAEK